MIAQYVSQDSVALMPAGHMIKSHDHIFVFKERDPHFVLVFLCLACKKFENFKCPDCQMAAPIAFFRDSLLLETFKRISIIFNYC